MGLGKDSLPPLADLLTAEQLQELIDLILDIEYKEELDRFAELKEFFLRFRDQLKEKGIDSDYLAHYVNKNYFK